MRDVQRGPQAVEVSLIDRKRLTYSRRFTLAEITEMPSPLRGMRLELEAQATNDLREVPHEYGDLCLIVRRSDWTVDGALDVWVDEDEPGDDLDESF